MNQDKAAMITAILEGIYNIARSAVKYNGGSLPEIPKEEVKAQ